jgi:transposase
MSRFGKELIASMQQAATHTGARKVPGMRVVERTIAWLNRCRRLAKDWENLNHKPLAFLRVASIRLMLRKLCNQT